MNKYREVVFYKSYFEEFFEAQPAKMKTKLLWTLSFIEDTERVPETYLKWIVGTDGLFEIRAQHASDIVRVFCFFEKDKIVVTINGFNKKSQKTPKAMIQKALKIKKQYEEEYH
ncbi:MAG: type II toxin-antitoxin system RelE/ParE family toxin [Bacteroidia bacterium]